MEEHCSTSLFDNLVYDSSEEARKHTLKVIFERERKHNQNRDTAIYQPGDIVYVKQHRQSDNLCNFNAKLANLFAGPYVVVAEPSPNMYAVQHQITAEVIHKNVKELKPSIPDDEASDNLSD